MSDNSVFSQLSSRLSPNEREDLLQKIRQAASFSTEPFLIETENRGPVDIEYEYEQLGLLTKIIIFFISLFSSRERNNVAEEYFVKRLIREIQREHPKLIDVSGNAALSTMYREIESLENAAAVFRTPLQTALEGEKQEFTAFLASFEMEVLHEQLEEAVDPFANPDKLEGKENEEIKKELRLRLEDLFLDITEGQRTIIGQQLFTLETLLCFCRFPFTRVLNKFLRREDDGEMVCTLDALQEQLLKLEQILFSLRVPPERVTIEALFLFLYRKEAAGSEENVEDKIAKQLKRTALAMQRLRQFHRNVPLNDILKFMLRDLNHFPETGSGKSDWFVQYKEYWHEILERRWKAFIEDRRKKQIIKGAAEFLQEPVFPLLHRYRDGTHSLLFHPRYQYSLSFLYHYARKFLGQVFRRELQTILIDGEFYKGQNRQDFTDSYNTLFQLEDRVRFVEDSLSEENSLGKRITAVDREFLTKPLKKKKIENVVDVMERENDYVIRSCISSLTELYNVVNGILYGEVGGRYDTLSNLSYLGGSDNKGFKKKLDVIISNLSEAKEHLNNVTTIER